VLIDGLPLAAPARAPEEILFLDEMPLNPTGKSTAPA
jgi:hypothetical protein